MSLIPKTSAILLLLCFSTFTITRTHHKLLKVDNGKPSEARVSDAKDDSKRFYPNCNKGCGKCVFDNFAVYCTSCYKSLLTKHEGTSNTKNWTCGEMQKNTSSTLKGCL